MACNYASFNLVCSCQRRRGVPPGTLMTAATSRRGELQSHTSSVVYCTVSCTNLMPDSAAYDRAHWSQGKAQRVLHPRTASAGQVGKYENITKRKMPSRHQARNPRIRGAVSDASIEASSTILVVRSSPLRRLHTSRRHRQLVRASAHGRLVARTGTVAPSLGRV